MIPTISVSKLGGVGRNCEGEAISINRYEPASSRGHYKSIIP
jgi:hypothetical protein